MVSWANKENIKQLEALCPLPAAGRSAWWDERVGNGGEGLGGEPAFLTITLQGRIPSRSPHFHQMSFPAWHVGLFPISADDHDNFRSFEEENLCLDRNSSERFWKCAIWHILACLELSKADSSCEMPFSSLMGLCSPIQCKAYSTWSPENGGSAQWSRIQVTLLTDQKLLTIEADWIQMSEGCLNSTLLQALFFPRLSCSSLAPRNFTKGKKMRYYFLSLQPLILTLVALLKFFYMRRVLFLVSEATDKRK